jgi:drug/metabolite transporter (DMT)-like permease
VTRANLLRFGVLALIWGSSFLLIKVALGGMTAPQLVLGRLSFGLVVLIAVMAIQRRPLPRDPKVWGHLAVLALVANVGPFFLFGWAESAERVTSGLAGVLNGTTPLLTLVIAIAALPEERASRTRLAGIGLGFAGVVTIIGPWRQGTVGGQLLGLLACLGAAACYGVSFNYTRRMLSGRGHPPVALACGQLLVATSVQVIVVALTSRHAIHADAKVVAAVVALGALGTGFAYLLYYGLIEDVGATTASMVTYVMPVVAVALGVVVRHEPLTWNLFVGAAVLILGVALAEGRIGPGRALSPATEAAGLASPVSVDSRP